MASNLPRPSTRTASRSTPRTARGTHAFEIVCYSLHCGLGVNTFLRSAAFDVGGYSWCIRLYPDGYLDGDNDDEDSRQDGNVAVFLELLSQDGNVAVFLELLSQDAEVRAHYDFRLLEHATGSSNSVASAGVPQVFDTLDTREDNFYAWGTDEFMERSELEEPAYLRNDRLVIECDVTVFMEPHVEKIVTSDNDAEMRPSDLSSSSGPLFERDDTGEDLTFVVKDKVFHAHKFVVAARLPIFAEIHGFKQDQEKQCVMIEAMQPAAFKALLHFVYTERMPSMVGLDGDEKEETVKQLLLAADRYGMNRLKLKCKDILRTSLARADQHRHGSSFRDAFVKYIANPLSGVGGGKASQHDQHLKLSSAEMFSYLLEKATKLVLLLIVVKYLVS